MKFDWKSRLRNPVFWATAVPSFFAFVYTLLGLFDVVPKISEDELVNLASAIVSMLSAIGVLVNPTTEGLGD